MVAIKSHSEHAVAFKELEESIKATERGQQELKTWEREVEAWELDRSQPNPFVSRVSRMLLLSSLVCSRVDINRLQR